MTCTRVFIRVTRTRALIAGAALTVSLVPCAVHAQGLHAKDFSLIVFQVNAWNKGNPDAAGCITYTAGQANAKVNVVQLDGVSTYQAANNARAIICNGAIHLEHNIIRLGDPESGLAPGYTVMRFSSMEFQQNRWNRNAPANLFLVAYTANAANSGVVIVVVGAGRVRFTLRAPNNGVIQAVDRFAHVDWTVEMVRIEVLGDRGDELNEEDLALIESGLVSETFWELFASLKAEP